MQNGRFIHIVTFHVPFPPNYGGAIDMFYKLKAMCRAGYKVILHTFLYDGERSEELAEICYKVYYYHRDRSVMQHLSTLPYIVKSRKNKNLIRNLLLDDYPILFEGLHSCYYLDDIRLAARQKYVRMHNIEHDYYHHLYAQRGWSLKKIYFLLESYKLKHYEHILVHAQRILAISDADQECLCKAFPDKDVRLLQCFFDDTPPKMEDRTDSYMLYHANLAVEENINAALYIMRSLLPKLPDSFRLTIAGRNPARSVCKEAALHANVSLVANPDTETLNSIIAHARINLLITFQPTGIKLKLLNTLVKSAGNCLVNSDMVHGNQLAKLCVVADTPQQQVEAIMSLWNVEPKIDDVKARIAMIRNLGYNDITPIVEP